MSGRRAEVFAEGFISPEGPAFDRDGNLFFVDWDADAIYCVTPAGEVSLFARSGGIPTGLAFHRDGRLFLADSGRNEVLAITPAGEMTVMAAAFEGVRLRGPNDLAFAANGDLYFTDPKGTNLENPVGSVYLLRPEGTLERFATGFAFPNGVMTREVGENRYLYLAETWRRTIHRFTLDAHGRAALRETFAVLEPRGEGPDGMAFDIEGNLYVAHYGIGAVIVLDLAGKEIDRLPTGGARPTNVAFWDTSLYVTEVERGQVLRFELGVRGQPLFGAQGRPPA